MLLLVVRHLLHFGVFRFDQHLMRAGEIFFNLLILTVLLDDFLEFGVLLGDFLVARGIGSHFGSGELLRQLVVASAKLVQLFSKGQCSHGKSSSYEIRKSKLENRNGMKRGAPVWERWEGQLIKGGVHRMLCYKNNPDVKFVQTELGFSFRFLLEKLHILSSGAQVESVAPVGASFARQDQPRAFV